MFADNEALLRYWIEEVWNKKRPEVIDELFAPHCKAHGMGPDGTDRTGPEGFKSAYATFCGAFPDLQITLAPVVANGDLVAGHLLCTGTHQGEHLGVPATHQPITFTAMTIARIENGKIVEGWNCIDLLSIFQQVGAMSPAESLP
ncbi:MAG: hypothetical protein OHK0029_20330 [Armatimonadaceae bacterium]